MDLIADSPALILRNGCLTCAGRIEISAQNHNYAVNPDTFQSGVEVSHVNLNDGTCAGIVVPALQVHSEIL